MKPAVQHWEISSRNCKKAQEFYRNIFGWEITEYQGMNYALAKPGDTDSIGGGIGEVQPGQNPSVTFYITVDDLRAYLDKIEKAGGKTLVPPSPIPGIGSFAMFADLDNNILGLYSSKLL